MDISQIRKVIHSNYGISIESIQKIKNVYKVQFMGKYFCFKIIKYNFGHFLFILNAMKHLQKNGFNKIPEFILTKDGKYYVEIDNRYAYLTEWIDAREFDYGNFSDVAIATYKLADFHKKSANFKVTKDMKPRIGWLRWIETYNHRKDEILDFKRRIEAKDEKKEFDIRYLSMMEEEMKRADKSIQNLKKSNYIEKMKKDILKREFCHHDYAQHNVLVNREREVYIIDFDYCILDSHIHDLSSMMVRVMKNQKWSLKKARFILDCYNKVNEVYEEDIVIMAAFMEFPQAYWQVGIQYYWEKQPWAEELFLNKLDKIYKDNEERQDFVECFRNISYKG